MKPRHSSCKYVTDVKIETAPAQIRELNMSELELVNGGARSFEDILHRMMFALNCVAGGGTLEVKGDQLHCHL